MSAPLPPIGNCLPACSEATIVQIPGPPGAPGAPGHDGLNGIDAYTITTAAFVQPAVGNSVTVAVDDSAWAVVGQKVFVGGGGGYYDVFAVPNGVSITLTNLGYTGNAAPTTNINGGVGVSPGGVKGADGANLQTLNQLSPTTTRGDIIADDGNGGGSASDVRMPVGTDGQVLAGDSTQTTGLHYATITPNAATDNAISRFDGTTGKPCALQNSSLLITDDGAIQSTPTGGNARGARAVDLQTVRYDLSEVASGDLSQVLGGIGNKATGTGATVVGGNINGSFGAQSFAGGGFNNNAIGDQSAVCGGSQNNATQQNAVVCAGNNNLANGVSAAVLGGSTNQATGAYSTIAGGTTNTASGASSGVGAGNSNQATGDYANVSGGSSNLASGTQSFVGAGNANQSTAQQSVVGGGVSNVSSGVTSSVLGGSANAASGVGASICGGGSNVSSNNGSFVGGGIFNSATGDASAVLGGRNALADKPGQISHANGRFAANGDAQASELIFRGSTADATPTEIFLNVASARATVPLNTTWSFSIIVTGRSSAGVSAGWRIDGVIQNNANTVSLASAVTAASLGDGSGSTWGVIGNVAVTADNTNKSLSIVCTGAAATNIRWGAVLKAMEIGF